MSSFRVKLRHILLLGLGWPLLLNGTPSLVAASIFIAHVGLAVLALIAALGVLVLAYLAVVRLYPQPAKPIRWALLVSLGIVYLLSFMSSDRVLGRYWRLTQQQPQLGLRVDEAPPPLGLGYYQFENGRLLPNFIHKESIVTSDADGNIDTTDYWVAPIVSEQWQAGEPVYVWAATTASKQFLAEWTDPIQGFGQQVSSYETAVRRANLANNWPLPTTPPLILDLQAQSPSELLNQTTRYLRWLYLALNLFAFVPLAIYATSHK